MDLGHGVLSQASAPGCPAAECAGSGLTCGPHSRYVVVLNCQLFSTTFAYFVALDPPFGV